MSNLALEHLKVLDLTHYRAGPYCTKLLAGFGADVIKIERCNSGDPLRHVSPFIEDKPGIDRSIPFHWLNTGKRSLTLNLKHNTGRALLLELVSWADILVENFSPRVLEELDLTYSRLQKINPKIIMTSISNFGQTGPYRDYLADEIAMYAMSGGMNTTGDPDNSPLAAGPAITQYTAGMHAYIGTLMALLRCASSGIGEHVDISIQESALENIEIQLVEHLHDGKVAHRNGDQHSMVPWQNYSCLDGVATIIGSPVRHWSNVGTLFNEPRLTNPPYHHMNGRIAHRQEFEKLMQPWLAKQSKKDIYHKGQKAGLAFGYLADFKEAMDSPQHKARSFFRNTESHPTVGMLKMCGPPFRSKHSEWSMKRAPLLGEHNTEIIIDLLGRDSHDLKQLAKEGII